MITDNRDYKSVGTKRAYELEAGDFFRIGSCIHIVNKVKRDLVYHKPANGNVTQYLSAVSNEKFEVYAKA